MSDRIFGSLFEYIEANLHTKINMPDAARTVSLSPVHLTRLFSFAYGITPAEYIRKRKLSESLRFLQETDRTVLEIALSFGFSHEQSFTRAFCAEFGTTPGKYRNEHVELPVLMPIPDFGMPCGNGRGRLFGPETVFLPKVRLLGIWHEIPYRNSVKLAPAAALGFWEKDRMGLAGGENATVFYGLTRHPGGDADCSRYLTAIEMDTDVDDMGNLGTDNHNTSIRDNFGADDRNVFKPRISTTSEGSAASAVSTTKSILACRPATDFFGGCPCVKFHYIGKHHYRELSQKTAQQMYRAIRKHIYSADAIPVVDGSVHLEKIDASEFDGEYCLMEWYAPIRT